MNTAISSWPNGIVYFWLSGQLLCKAQRREHSRSYVTVVVTPQSDCPLSQKIRFHLVNYLYQKKRTDPLGLNELISWSDDDRFDWLADILE